MQSKLKLTVLSGILFLTAQAFAMPKLSGYWICNDPDGREVGALGMVESNGIVEIDSSHMPLEYPVVGAIDCSNHPLSSLSAATTCDRYEDAVHSETHIDEEAQTDFKISAYGINEIRVRFQHKRRFFMLWFTQTEYLLDCFPY